MTWSAPSILGGTPLPHQPPPMMTRHMLQELSGLRPVMAPYSLSPMTADDFDRACLLHPCVSVAAVGWQAAIEENSTTVPLLGAELLVRGADTWLGPPSSAMTGSPCLPGDAGTADGLCWATKGGQAAACLLAALASGAGDEQALCENFRDWSHTDFSVEDARLLGLLGNLSIGREMMESLMGCHARCGSLVALLVKQALQNRRWVPSWLSWMRTDARGAWLLVSSGQRAVAWPEVAPARALMRREKRA